jgi:hypothetical protein
MISLISTTASPVEEGEECSVEVRRERAVAVIAHLQSGVVNAWLESLQKLS